MQAKSIVFQGLNLAFLGVKNAKVNIFLLHQNILASVKQCILNLNKKCEFHQFSLIFQEELDLSAPNKTAMLSLPKEKKWQIYCSQKGSLGNETGLSNDPESYIENVNHLSGQEFAHELEENRQRAKGLDSLQIALRTQPNSFVMRFMEAEGLTQLLDFLAAMDYETRQSSIHTALLGCIKALMNNSVSKSST